MFGSSSPGSVQKTTTFPLRGDRNNLEKSLIHGRTRALPCSKVRLPKGRACYPDFLHQLSSKKCEASQGELVSKRHRHSSDHSPVFSILTPAKWSSSSSLASTLNPSYSTKLPLECGIRLAPRFPTSALEPKTRSNSDCQDIDRSEGPVMNSVDPLTCVYDGCSSMRSCGTGPLGFGFSGRQPFSCILYGL